MPIPLAEHRATLLSLGRFVESDLSRCLASAVARQPEEPAPPPTMMQVAVGFVLLYTFESDKTTHYRLLVDGNVVDAGPRSFFSALEDGRSYRVYFTPKGETLHALEPVAASEVPDAVAEAVGAVGLSASDPAAWTDARVESIVRRGLLSALGRSFDFTTEDLVANRRGQLTSREQKKLRGEASGCFGAAILFALLGGVVSIGFASGRHPSLVGSAICAVLAVALVAWMIYLGVVRRTDATAGRVVYGIGRIVHSSGDRHGRMVLENGTTMPFPVAALSIRGHVPARLAAVSYLVYFAPHEPEIMSLEPVDLAPVLAPIAGS